MRNGYLLAYTGNLGKSKKNLQTLRNSGVLHTKSKFVNIKLREKFVKQSCRFLSSGMDISDGLYSDLEKLSSVNKTGFKFHKKISKFASCSGEEYEMLVAFDKRNQKTMQRRAKQTRTPLNIFATSARIKYNSRCKAHHF